MGKIVVRITVDTLHLQLHFANWPRRVTVTVIFHRQSSPSTVGFTAARGQSTILGGIFLEELWGSGEQRLFSWYKKFYINKSTPH